MNGQVMFDGSVLPEQVPDNNIVLTDPSLRARFYHQQICDCIATVKHSLFQTCCFLYRMQDENLYHLLGFEDFKDYCENCLHFSYSQAVRYSAVGRFVSNQSVAPVLFDEDYIQDLGITKLYELAKLQSDELKLLFDDYPVAELSRSELRDGIKTVKAFKKARDVSGFSESLAEFKKLVLDTVEVSDSLSVNDAQVQFLDQSEDPSDLSLISDMVRLLLSLQSALEQVQQFYKFNEKLFNDDLHIYTSHFFSRLYSSLFNDINNLNKHLSDDKYFYD